MDLGLKGKVAVVTGASRGLGKILPPLCGIWREGRFQLGGSAPRGRWHRLWPFSPRRGQILLPGLASWSMEV